MEEKKNTQGKKPLTMEELSKVAGELHQENQYLKQRLQQLTEALNDSDFGKVSFIINMLFKVIENKDTFSPEFVIWCIEKVEGSLKSFYDGSTVGETEEKNEA